MTFRKEVGLTKFIPKAVLENMKVSLCNKCVHVQAVFVYPVVIFLGMLLYVTACVYPFARDAK